MRAVLQRVTQAEVRVAGEVVGSIDAGLLVLLGVAPEDNAETVDWMAAKVLGLRIFADAEKPMNRSVQDIGGEILVVSQFTLTADTSRGKRPSFVSAAAPEHARAIYDLFVSRLDEDISVSTGKFGADMQVQLINDGPVTFVPGALMAASDSLFALAEIAILIAGFAAIVVVLRRDKDGGWDVEDAQRFQGMLAHAAFAVTFCFVPTLVNVVVQDPVTSLHIACALLGVQILGHSVGAMLLSSPRASGYLALTAGALIGLLQFTAFTDWGVQREFDLYLVGIIWHILMAGMLFLKLVRVSPKDAD